MALWLVHVGSHGESEQKLLAEGRIYLIWDGLGHDLGAAAQKADLCMLLQKIYPDSSKGQVSNCTGQIWVLAHAIGGRRAQPRAFW